MCQADVIRVLQEAGRPMRMPEIVEATGRSYSSCLDSLRRLKVHGEVTYERKWSSDLAGYYVFWGLVEE